MIETQRLDLFSGIPVVDYASALKWYEQLLGYPPTFYPLATEAVWEVAEHRYLYIVQQPEIAGHARLTLFVSNLDEVLEKITRRGLEPAEQQTLPSGVRKITYRDTDGNEIGFGGAPK